METLLANLVRNVASSMAVSPPPTTMSCLSLKKKPSQVAQAETPCPMKPVLGLDPQQLGGGAGGDDQGVTGVAVLARLQRDGPRAEVRRR